jgi:hypothetical protein
MNKKTRDFLNGLGMLATVIAMVVGGGTLFYLFYMVFHTHSK